MGVVTISRALLARLLFVLHGLLATWRLYMLTADGRYWLNVLTVLFMIIEACTIIQVRDGKEWQWFCPAVFVYLLFVVPPIWFLEIISLDEKYRIKFQNHSEHESPHEEIGTQMDSLKQQLQSLEQQLALQKIPNEHWIMFLEQALMFVLVIGRWLMPKGRLTHDELSQLLLVYIGTAADIVEFFQTFQEKALIEVTSLRYLVLGVWSWSLLQFCIVQTAGRSRQDKTGVIGSNKRSTSVTSSKAKAQSLKNKNQSRPRTSSKRRQTLSAIDSIISTTPSPQLIRRVSSMPETDSVKLEMPSQSIKKQNCCSRCCDVGADVFSIILSILMQDLPFMTVRLILVIHYEVFSYSHLFFTLKNCIVILLLIYRLIVIACKNCQERRVTKGQELPVIDPSLLPSVLQQHYDGKGGAEINAPSIAAVAATSASIATATIALFHPVTVLDRQSKMPLTMQSDSVAEAGQVHEGGQQANADIKAESAASEQPTSKPSKSSPSELTASAAENLTCDAAISFNRSCESRGNSACDEPASTFEHSLRHSMTGRDGAVNDSDKPQLVAVDGSHFSQMNINVKVRCSCSIASSNNGSGTYEVGGGGGGGGNRNGNQYNQASASDVGRVNETATAQVAVSKIEAKLKDKRKAKTKQSRNGVTAKADSKNKAKSQQNSVFCRVDPQKKPMHPAKPTRLELDDVPLSLNATHVPSPLTRPKYQSRLPVEHSKGNTIWPSLISAGTTTASYVACVASNSVAQEQAEAPLECSKGAEAALRAPSTTAKDGMSSRFCKCSRNEYCKTSAPILNSNSLGTCLRSYSCTRAGTVSGAPSLTSYATRAANGISMHCICHREAAAVFMTYLTKPVVGKGNRGNGICTNHLALSNVDLLRATWHQLLVEASTARRHRSFSV